MAEQRQRVDLLNADHFTSRRRWNSRQKSCEFRQHQHRQQQQPQQRHQQQQHHQEQQQQQQYNNSSNNNNNKISNNNNSSNIIIINNNNYSSSSNDNSRSGNSNSSNIIINNSNSATGWTKNLSDNLSFGPKIVAGEKMLLWRWPLLRLRQKIKTVENKTSGRISGFVDTNETKSHLEKKIGGCSLVWIFDLFFLRFFFKSSWFCPKASN